MAAANGHLDIVKLLIEKFNININLQNSSGNTALHWAAVNGLKEIVAYLISKKADVLITNKSGKIAAQEAYEKNFYEVSEILIDVEVALKKDEIIQTPVDKNDLDDQIDLDVDIDKIESEEAKDEMNKLNINK